MRNILLLVGGVAALFLLSRFRFGQKAIFQLRTLRPGGSLLQPTINVEMAVQNPTNSTIKIKSITGSLSLNNKYLANVSAFGDQTVAPNSESTLRLVARPSALGVFESVRELLTAPAGQVKAIFEGSANVDGIVVPITETRRL
jgi:LEA14-like dessication related protein